MSRSKTAERASGAELQKLTYAAAKAEVEEKARQQPGWEGWTWTDELEERLKHELLAWRKPPMNRPDRMREKLREVLDHKPVRKKVDALLEESLDMAGEQLGGLWPTDPQTSDEERARMKPQALEALERLDLHEVRRVQGSMAAEWLTIARALATVMRCMQHSMLPSSNTDRTELASVYALGETVPWRASPHDRPTARDLALLSILLGVPALLSTRLGVPDWRGEPPKTAAEAIEREEKAMRVAMDRIAAITATDEDRVKSRTYNGILRANASMHAFRHSQ